MPKINFGDTNPIRVTDKNICDQLLQQEPDVMNWDAEQSIMFAIGTLRYRNQRESQSRRTLARIIMHLMQLLPATLHGQPNVHRVV